MSNDIHDYERHDRRESDHHANEIRNLSAMVETQINGIVAMNEKTDRNINALILEMRKNTKQPIANGWLPHVSTLLMVGGALLTVYLNINNSLITTVNDIRNLQKSFAFQEKKIEKYEGDILKIVDIIADLKGVKQTAMGQKEKIEKINKTISSILEIANRTKNDLEFQTNNSANINRSMSKRLRELEGKK